MPQQEVKLIRFDWAIKNILRNKANFDVLEGFLSELLKKQVVIESLLESESNQETADSKFNRVDLMVNIDGKERVIIEVQSASQWDFWQRILFGTSKVITEYLVKGDAYKNISKVISVSILFFNLGKGTDYIYKGATNFTGIHNHDVLELNHDQTDLYIQQNCKLPGDIFPEYYIIQLNSFKNIILDKFDEWVYLLKNDAVKPEFNAQGVISAKEKLDVLKLSEEMRAKYEYDALAMSLEASLIDSKESEMRKAVNDAKAEGKAEGIAEGKAEGVAEGIKQTAKVMLDKQLSLEIISEVTGLSREQLLQLKS